MRLLVAAYSMRTEDFGISEDVGDLACGYPNQIHNQTRQSYLTYPSDKKATESVNGGSKQLQLKASFWCIPALW